jgi:hypothetical protein
LEVKVLVAGHVSSSRRFALDFINSQVIEDYCCTKSIAAIIFYDFNQVHDHADPRIPLSIHGQPFLSWGQRECRTLGSPIQAYTGR